MTPKINDRPLYKLNVPDFSGGINYRDGISQVLDNQLTDGRNVWYRNGMLKTRPGARFAVDDSSDTIESVSPTKIYTKKENYRVINGVSYFLAVLQSKEGLDFRYYANEKEYKFLVKIPAYELPSAEFNCNIFQYNTEIYCFCSGYYEGQSTPYYIFKVYEDSGSWIYKRIKDEDLYVPTIATNLFPVATGEDAPSSGDFLEGYNLLGNHCKFVYSTIDPNSAAEDVSMYFVLPYKLVQYDKNKNVEWAAKGDFTAEIIHSDYFNAEDGLPVGTVTHKITLTESFGLSQYAEEANFQRDRLKLVINGQSFYFVSQDSGDAARIPVSDFVRNNMTVTVPCRNEKGNYEKVLNMTRAEWFGGGSEGIYGGIHLFMCGNTAEKEKALVLWSDFNRPLYFSENGYTYVGDKSQRATAFGKQGESLVIFKERETYATQYSSIDEPIEAESVVNQSVIDATVAEVSFPMIQVHGFIGCDCPDSVQLCRNRLVWAHSDGKIYTLASANQWSERSIYEVSDMVERALKEYTPDQLKTALSADWEGYYMLSLGDKFYLMDYNSYGYTHVYSYSKEDDGQMYIPWWIWDKPTYPKNTYNRAENVTSTTETVVPALSLVTLGANLYIWTELINIEKAYIFETVNRHAKVMVLDGADDMVPDFRCEVNPETTEVFRWVDIVAREIPAMAQTKLFDFGTATTIKSVPKCEISFGVNDGQPISVTTITDRGESSREFSINSEEANERQPQFFRSVVIRNGHSLCSRIGYRIESSGNVMVDAMQLYYKQLGGAK
jgi:hypothetical protein